MSVRRVDAVARIAATLATLDIDHMSRPELAALMAACAAVTGRVAVRLAAILYAESEGEE